MDTLAPLTGAALTTAAIMYPVDVLRALKMSAAAGGGVSPAEFLRKHGVKGMFGQGVIPELAKSTTMRVSKFFFFPIVNQGLWGKKPAESSPLQKGLAGALATVPEIVMISPMEVAKIGLQLDKDNMFKNDSRAFIQHIYRTRGVSGLWCGWAGMQWRQSFWTGTYFATLSSFTGAIQPTFDNMGAPLSVTKFTAGFAAGVFAAIPNGPGDVVRSVVQKRMFEDAAFKRKAYGIGVGSVIEHAKVAQELIATRGVRALYSGFTFKAMHMGGSGALMAMLVPVFTKLMGIDYGGV